MLRCTRWCCVVSGWKVGAALGSHRARSSHCQVLAFLLTHSPEGGSQWCQITPGVPTPRLLGVCGCSCEWNMQHSARARRCGWLWKVASGVDVRELRSEHIHEESTRAHYAYHAKTLIHSKRRPTYASEYVHKRHEENWLVAGNANVTSKSMASDTFNCRLPRCERATLYGIPPSVWTIFLHMYEPSLPKLVGGVMATSLHSRLDVEVEPCNCEW